ncbi:penicillin-binding protein 1C [Bdellovibrio sp. HCB337]|uniref:penicillin-binding protein 1C n=1 Tax=Bdellovibrio sp. HCB337 TaxID=3394358 RepID=UPI0039A629C1
MQKRWKKISVIVMVLVGALGIFRAFRPPLLESASFSKVVFASHGELLRFSISNDDKYRLPARLESVDPKLVEAFLLHEDKYFYCHPGVNPFSMVRAIYSTVTGSRMGGSTITMQLARLQDRLYTRSVTGKLLQILSAFKLELLYSKKEILEAYLNLTPFGGNIEGVEAASLIYYGKPAKNLSLSEALTLAVIPQSPQVRSLNQESPARVSFLKSRSELFAAWAEKHPGDKNQSLDLALPMSSQKVHDLPFLAPHFVDLMLQRFPEKSELETTLDLDIQRGAEKKLKAYVSSLATKGVKNAALMVLNIETMEIQALVGSSDFFNAEIEGQVNGVVAKRSPGSALKPLLYALALDQGLIHPLTLLKDTPMSFAGYDPENFDQNFRGPLSATDALVHSRNVPAVYLDSQVKSPSFYDFLKDFGVSQLKTAKHYGLSLSLGGAEVSMEEMLQLYSVLARQGYRLPVRWLKEQKTPSHVPQLISKEAAFVTLDMLTKNPRPEGQDLNSILRTSMDVAWKTGTSFGFRDAWAVGAFGPFVVGVWLGNFDGEGNPAFIGRDLAGPLLFQMVDLLKPLAETYPLWKSMSGLGLKKVKVCSISGHFPGPHCRHQQETWFIPGKSPISTCNIHREVMISNLTGLRLCAPPADPKMVRTEVYEFWPTDLLAAFKSFGVIKRNPPSFEPKCRLAEGGLEGNPPQINSPKMGVVYHLGVLTKDKNEIPLQAILDSDVEKVTWFVNNELVGVSEGRKALLWKARPGKYIVRAVDDLGRSDSRDLEVQIAR